MHRVLLLFLVFLIPALASAQGVVVKRVIDGDTFIAQDGDTTYDVRMLYVDTPESVHPDRKRNIPMGKVASNWSKNCLEKKSVVLKYPQNKEENDVFHRKLALVFLHGTCINLELVRIGLSPYYTKYGKAPEPWHTRFQQAEKVARDSSKGIWSDPKLTKQYLRLKSKWGKRTSIRE